MMSGQAENSKPAMPVKQGRELVLVKHDQRYVFRCAAGEESQLLEQLITLAKDSSSDIDWFDAAVLSHQMGQKFNQQITAMLKS